MATDISKIHLKMSWKDLTEGMVVCASGSSKEFKTGEWTTRKAVVDEEKCIHCLICTPVCPDSAIPVVDGKRGTIDTDHCKGCGICVQNCPKGAIEMKEGM